jgi:hypothetical protein
MRENIREKRLLPESRGLLGMPENRDPPGKIRLWLAGEK